MSAGTWQVNFFWWGKADVTRPCAKEEWDGNLMINGIPHVRAPGAAGPMEPEAAKALADALNAADGAEGVPLAVTGDDGLVPRLVAFADRWEVKEPVKAKLARDAADRITGLQNRLMSVEALLQSRSRDVQSEDLGGETAWLG